MTSPTAVTAAGRIEASVSRVFEVVSRYDQVVKVIDGLDSLSPDGDATQVAGARFMAVFRLPGRQITTEVVLAELDTNRRVLWQTSGGDRSVLFETKELEPSLTAVRLSVSYERPGGIAGSVIGAVIEETVRSRARASLERLRQLTSSD